MKVIVTGSTGSVGGAVLQQCIKHPSITSIIALTRRPLEVKDPKIKTIIHTDYLTYPPELMNELEGAEACIWALGPVGGNQLVHVDYPTAAVKAFQASLVPALKEGQKFRFVLTSGGLVPTLDKLAVLYSKIGLRGDLDRRLLSLEGESSGTWETFVARPWFVVDEPPAVRPAISRWMGEGSYIYKSELGAAMVDSALNSGEPRLMDNAELRRRGQAALERLKS